MAIFRCRIIVRYLAVSVFICLSFYFWYNYSPKVSNNEGLDILKQESDQKTVGDDENEVVNVPDVRLTERKSYKTKKLNYDVHIFYYSWYGNPVYNGEFYHWNHPILPSWKEKNNSYPLRKYDPPESVGASFYPELGAYSSKDPSVIKDHMRQLKLAGVGVIAVSWYPPNHHDDQGYHDPKLLKEILDHADQHQIKVCLHIEPFKKRNVATMRSALKSLFPEISTHSAFYKYHDVRTNKTLPLYYIYDSYLLDPDSWAQLLQPPKDELANQDTSIRNTPLDGVFIGLLVERKHMTDLMKAGFDGFYTYFGTDTFTFGSNPAHWPQISTFARRSNMIFIPSVAPGYNDETIRPWNQINTRGRRNGEYYDRYAKSALTVRPPLISITSFNEWHEGTQIEKAVPYKVSHRTYLNYLPHDPDYYLTATSEWVSKFAEQKIDNSI